METAFIRPNISPINQYVRRTSPDNAWKHSILAESLDIIFQGGEEKDSSQPRLISVGLQKHNE
jgi:hypothetical protein